VAQTYSYTIPTALEPLAKIGCRVRVPFGKQKAVGYILEKGVTGDRENLKEIFKIMDEEPLFPPELVPFFQWMAEYYRFPIGRLIQSALPGGLNLRSFKTARLTSKGLEVLALLSPRLPEHKTLSWIKRHANKKLTLPLDQVQPLLQKGWVLVENMEQKARGGPLIKKWIKAKPGAELPPAPDAARKSPDTRNEAEFLKIIMQREGILLSELNAQFKNSTYLIDKWLKKGLLECYQAPAVRDLTGKVIFPAPVPVQLFKQQQKVLKAIQERIDLKNFSVFLVHGVTGSGKTEVYFHAIAHACRQKKQSILLVPEIALAVYMEGLFRSRLGERVAIYHSGLSERERYQQWMKIARGEVDLVIGARSALFAPFPRLGLIIVDEEHEFAYKQEEAPRYQARDAAIVRGKMQKVPVILGSGTPAVQSFHNALTKRYQLLSMPERVEKRPLPLVQVIDMKTRTASAKEEILLSPELKRALEHTLAQGQQAMLFLNRRGFNRVHLCRFCGQTIRCRNCDLALIFHLKAGRLACHYCGYRIEPPKVCPSCGRAGLKTFGFGTEKLEEELKRLFPQSRIARMDRDSVRHKGETYRILKLFNDRELDILLGTQMITKGYDFPNVTLVGVIAADFSLGFPDFRASERTFQLLAQVGGRAGRGDKPGQVIIQTFNPEHYAILSAKDHDFEKFYRDEITLRKQLNYPPFAYLACLRLQGNTKEETMLLAQKAGREMERLLKAWPQKMKEIQILGPVEAPLSRLKGKYRWQILLKSKQSGLLHQFLDQAEEAVLRLLRSKGVSLSIDIDPYNML
jgi:primosomal protein N' (replication factor Y)